MKVEGADAKWALRQVLYRYVPRGMIDRPKMGFTAFRSTSRWLRGPLRDWAEGILIDEGGRAGIFAAKPVRAMWQRHQSGSWYPICGVF
jgi:asparagine synthase (glutamine-hydrolysing)